MSSVQQAYGEYSKHCMRERDGNYVAMSMSPASHVLRDNVVAESPSPINLRSISNR